MVVTQIRSFVIGKSFGLQRVFATVERSGLQRRGHRLFGNVAFLW